MFYLYILGSQKDKNIYIGSTNNLRKRLEEHNSGKVSSTKSRTPLELLYYEAYKTEQEARDREQTRRSQGRTTRFATSYVSPRGRSLEAAAP